MKHRIAIGIAGTGLIAGLALLGRPYEPVPLPVRAPAERPTLALLTSLPLMFGESFGIESGGSPALSRLEQRYNVQPVGVADAASLQGRTLLLMAHPRAQPAAALVDLDRWVRDGGKLLLLADPKLEWESERPLGDRLRPPPAFADTGLLVHWGISLSGTSATQGKLAAARCEVVEAGLVARCRIGKGAATVFADADFMNVGKDPESQANLEMLMLELARLETL